MSTLQSTPQRRNKSNSRPGAAMLALSTLAAIGLALLILVPTNQRAIAPTTSPAANRAPAGYFRDPATHELQRLSAAPHPATQNPANHSRGRTIP